MLAEHPRQRLWADLLLVAILCLPAAWPFLTGDLPRTNDIWSHLYRGLQMQWLLADGIVFPRWGPQLVAGFGYPVFNYFPYAAHSLLGALMLAGLSGLNAYRVASTIALLGSGVAAFLLGRDLYHRPLAGLIAALGYVYSPYLLYTSHVRGSLPEALALVWLPLSLWALLHAARDRRQFVAVAGFSFGAYIVSHMGVAVQASGLLLVWGLWFAREHGRQGVMNVALALALGIGLTAFFWLPAVLELGAAQFGTMQAVGNDYRANFTTLTSLFDYPTLPIDTALLNPSVRRPIAIVPLLGALVAVLQLRRFDTSIRRTLLCIAVLALGSTVLLLDVARPLWDTVLLLQLTLWPWRYLGPAGLFLALLAAANVLFFDGARRRAAIGGAGAVTLLLAAGLPFVVVPREPFPSIDRAAMLDSEIPPLMLGSTIAAEYLPRWVSTLPDLEPAREAMLTELDFDRLQTQDGVQARHTRNTLYRDDYEIVASEPATLTWNVFYFPGWQVWLDGDQVAPRIATPHGLVAVDVPAGEHSVSLRFGSTPLRTAASAVSVAALAVTLVVAFLPETREEGAPVPGLPGWWWLFGPILAALALAVLALRLPPLSSNEAPGSIQHPLDADLGGELTLLGYSTDHSAFAADEPVDLDLYWQANQPLGVAYGFNLRLIDSQGRIWNNPEIERPADWRFVPGTDGWPTDAVIVDSYTFRVLPGTPPGDYTLTVVAFRRDTLAELATATVGPLTVTAPSRALPVEFAPTTQGPLNIAYVRADRTEAAPGDPLRIDALWQVRDAGNLPTAATLHIGDAMAVELPFNVGGGYPVAAWQPGDVLAGQWLLNLPADLPGGDYPLSWSLGDERFALGTRLIVTTPERAVDLPPSLTPVPDAPALGPVRLAGASVPATASPPALTVTLAWQTEALVDTRYRAFVHLVAPDGALAAQHDAEPANWQRPTTGWLPGEIVVDEHTLELPADIAPGSYSLRAGLYDPLTGLRLGGTVVELGTVVVE